MPALRGSNRTSDDRPCVKLHLIVALMGAAAAPVVISQTVPDSAMMGGDSDLMTKAKEIAEKEFSSTADLRVEKVWVANERTGTFGERIRPDPGYAFHVAQVRITNSGKLDFAVSTWHFSGLDEIQSDHSAKLGNAHEDFDASRLPKGQSRDGVVIFELEKGSYLTGVFWQGDLSNATATAPMYEHP